MREVKYARNMGSWWEYGYWKCDGGEKTRVALGTAKTMEAAVEAAGISPLMDNSLCSGKFYQGLYARPSQSKDLSRQSVPQPSSQLEFTTT